MLTLTEAELEEIILEALDDAIPRAVQVAVAEERGRADAAGVERDEYKRLWLEEQAATRGKILRWQLATGASALLTVLTILLAVF